MDAVNITAITSAADVTGSGLFSFCAAAAATTASANHLHRQGPLHEGVFSLQT